MLTLISRSKYALDIATGLIAMIIAVGVSILWSPSIGVIAAAVIASTIGAVMEKWK
ncbi:hypothetical protein D3C72_2469020 [compost metagenome]